MTVVGELAFAGPRLDEWRARVAARREIARAEGVLAPAPAAGETVTVLLAAAGSDALKVDEASGHVWLRAELDGDGAARVAAAWLEAAAMGAEGELYLLEAARGFALRLGRPGPALLELLPESLAEIRAR